MMRLPRTVRLDVSDRSVFERAAEPGEWAVTGSFAFLDDDPAAMAGKRLQAFRHGFLGTDSFGWSTLVVVAEASEAACARALEALARHFVDRYDAPSLHAARDVAERELRFASSLCEHEIGTMLTVYRQHGDGGVVEQFATVHRDPGAHGGLDLVGLAARQGPAP